MIKNKFLCSLLCSTVVSLSFATEMPYKSTKSHRNSEYISINEKRYVREINRHSDMTFRIDAKKKTCVIDAASFTNAEIHSINIVSYNPKLKVIIKGKFKEHINDVTFSPQIYFQIRDWNASFENQYVTKEVCCHIWDFINEDGGYYKDFATYDANSEELIFKDNVLNGADLSLVGMIEWSDRSEKIEGKLFSYIYERNINPIKKIVLPNDTCLFVTDYAKDKTGWEFGKLKTIEIHKLVLPAQQNGSFRLIFASDRWDSSYGWHYPTKGLYKIENVKALCDFDIARLSNKYIDRGWSMDIANELSNRNNDDMVDAFMQLMDGAPAQRGLMYMIVNTLKGQENFIELIDKYIECPVIGSSDLENIADKPLINLRHLTKWLKELELNEMCPLNPALVKQYINQKIIERVNAIFMECNNTFHSVFKRLNAVYKVGYDDRDITYMINKIRIYEALNEAFEPVVIHDSVRNFNELLLREITDILKHEINKCDDPLLFNINIVQNMMIELNNFNNMDPRINDAVKIIAEERNKTYERAFKKLVDILIDELCFCRIKDNRTRRAIGLRKLQLFVNSVHVPRPPKVAAFKEYIDMLLDDLPVNHQVNHQVNQHDLPDFEEVIDRDSDESLE